MKNSNVIKACGTRKNGKGCGSSLKKTDKKLYEFPFFVEDSFKKAA